MAIHEDDRRLVRRILAGEEPAFDEFFNDFFYRVFRFAMTRLDGDREASQEVAQETLSKALRNLSSYRGEAALFTWLCSICRNVTTDWRRKHGRHAEHLVLIEDYPEVRASMESRAAPAAEQPEHVHERAEGLRLIQVALDSLPPRYGDALEWKYVEGHSVKAIARRLGIGIEAAQSLLARARRAFAETYGALLDGLDEHANGRT